MDVFAAKKLFDIVTRQSIYIEQVKLGETEYFSTVLVDIEDEFKKLLPRLKYDNLDGLSKAQLNIFLKDLRVSQTRVYSRYQRQLIERLQNFMATTTVQTMQASASFYAHTSEDEISLLSLAESKDVIEQAMKDNNSSSLFGFAVLGATSAAFGLLWSKIKNSPLPSGGAFPVDYINFAIAKAMVDMENTVRSAWANKKTVAELKADVLGGNVTKTTADGTKSEDSVAGVLKKTNNAVTAVVATTMQHVAQQSISAVNSALWPEYVWVSIIDGRTSTQCFFLNGKHWPYGKGPMPPAHPWCRSHTMPFKYWDADFEMPSFYDWMNAQPQGFIKDAFGVTIAKKLKDGSLTKEDVKSLKVINSKTIAELLASTGNLI